MSRGERYRFQRNWGARILECTYKGMQAVFLENEKLRIGVLVDKGTDIFELNYKPRDMDFVWLTAKGIQNPMSYLSTSPDSLATFLDYYLGGWQEILPSGGAPSSYLGAAFGQHGEVSNLPWDYHIGEDTAEQIAVTFTVRLQKTPFSIEKTLRLRSMERCLRVEETLLNESEVPLRAMWGQHITFGRPFLDENCTIRLPGGITVHAHPTSIHPQGRRRVKSEKESPWPLVEGTDGALIDLSQLPPRGTASELVYLKGFQQGWYEVMNPAKGLGLRVEWDVTQMPYLWFWQEYGDNAEYPWYGRHYNIGLEPFSSYPTNGLAEAVANGSALSLDARQERHFSYRATVIEP
jgi:galactose mutarotase-like enzyme